MKKGYLSRRNFVKAGLGVMGGATVFAGRAFAEKYKKGVTLNPGMGHSGDQTMLQGTKNQ